MSILGFFTRAKEKEQLWTAGGRTKEKKGGGASLSGEEARDFYQSLIREEDGERHRVKKEERKERRRQAGHAGRGARHRPARDGSAPSTAISERDGHKLLRCAQEGDVQALKQLLDRGCDPNFHDSFYWTPVMCASHAGQKEAVRLLLERGATWIGVVDTQGRDARDLAVQAGHQDVVMELEQFGITENAHLSNSTPSSSPQWCDVCEVTYTENPCIHTTSTLHQFNVKRPPTAPHYCLPPSSVSYKMMLRSGWDPASGLGPAHAGQKNPVRTVLKRDQAGLGHGSAPRAKVTHFQAKDPQAVQRMPKERGERRERGATVSAKSLRRRKEEEKKWEREFRTSFNIDI